jgi:hypothetical protein
MQRSREYLYDRFKNNQKPNENDFRDLIDSGPNFYDDNTGWYYYRFVPHKVDEKNAFKIAGGKAEALIAPSPSGARVTGGMSILKPKGLSNIEEISIKGNITNVRNPIKVIFNLWDSSSEDMLHSEEMSFTRPVVENPNPQNTTLTWVRAIEKRIDPNDAILYIEVELDPGRVIVADDRTSITVTRIGIKFT